ncbi:MAG: prepilin-type N-terminal cleavage/methylation domain-containing protein, partial [Planctomycetes bacterium]|nr:prepilin-type N-terminal cleavage/methylation domain-containing protein [Planctomycetota bacterium]
MARLKGFTLIELLVVIAIIALLMAIIMPALNSVKKKAATTVCLTNTKNLSLGWYMYMGDNDDHIMSSEDNGIDKNGTYVGWCGVPHNVNGSPLSNTQADPPVTDEDEKRGIEIGVLYQSCSAQGLRCSLWWENCPILFFTDH